jgi:hypothetical protein
MASGNMELRVAAGAPPRVYGSSELTTAPDAWQFLGFATETPPQSGFFRFEDRQASVAHRFYILRNP